jgi:FkbM family methyltransferase
MNIRKYLPRNFKNKIHKIILGYTGFNPCFSQGGEDMILRTVFKGVNNGFFVDVGAYHPTVGSNTYFLYRTQMWRGINIDPNSRNIAQFNKARPGDTNIKLAIGKGNGSINYYHRDSPSMNFCSLENLPTGSYNSLEKIELSKLSTILESNNVSTIDLLTIDVEGNELEVLKSNNWNKFRPKVIVIEQSLMDLKKKKSTDLLEEEGYRIFSITTLGINNTDIMFNIFFARPNEFPGLNRITSIDINISNSSLAE